MTRVAPIAIAVLALSGAAVADPSEPHFPIANAYDAHGWISLCESRGQPRLRGGDIDELATYVHAWCAPSRDDRLEALNGLTHAKTPNLAAAARADIVDMLADSRDASASRSWLEDHHEPVGDDLPNAYARLESRVPAHRDKAWPYLHRPPGSDDTRGDDPALLDSTIPKGYIEDPVVLTRDWTDAAFRETALRLIDINAKGCHAPITRADVERYLQHPADPKQPYAELEQAYLVAMRFGRCRP